MRPCSTAGTAWKARRRPAQRLETGPGQFTDWSLGVNFSVPLGLRQGRAAMRQAELILVRDRANLDQGVHAALNEVADSVRNLSQFYEQYKAFRETRTAARINLEQQLAEFRVGRAIFLNVLQAITDWGNAVSSEAQALAQYNTELARLERVIRHDPGNARRAVLRGAVQVDRPARPAGAAGLLSRGRAAGAEHGSLSGGSRCRRRGAGKG